MPGDHNPKYKSCVSKVKAKGGDVNPYAVCHSSTGEIEEAIIREKINGNRQVPFFNPPIKNNTVEPKIDKSPKGKIGGTENHMTNNMWKEIFDSQLKRNVKEPRY